MDGGDCRHQPARRIDKAEAIDVDPLTPRRQEAYPQPSQQKPGCGFLVLKLVAVMSLATFLVGYTLLLHKQHGKE